MATSSKTDEAAQEAAMQHLCADIGPPAYEIYEEDVVYDTASTSTQQFFTEASRRFILEDARPVLTSQAGIPDPLMKPLSLTMDGDLIYPTLPPSTAMYHLAENLTWTGRSIRLERSVPERLRKSGTKAPVDDQELYEIVRTSEGTIEIIPKRVSCYGKGTAIMKKTSMFHSDAWEVWCQKARVMTHKKDKWLEVQGKTLAVEEKHEKLTGEEAYKVRRNIVFEIGVDRKMMNLLVAAWTALAWLEVLRVHDKELPSKPAHDIFRDAYKSKKGGLMWPKATE